MALTKQKEITSMNVLADGQIQVQETTTIFEDGVEIASTIWREVLDPADEITSTDGRGKTRDKKVMDMVNLVHTPSVVNARRQKLQEMELNTPNN